MLLGGTVEALVLVSVLVPLRRRLVRDLPAPTDGPFARHPVIGLIAPLAGFLDRLIAPEARERPASFYASIAIFASPLVALTLLPIGLIYAFDSGEVALAAVRLDGGIAWLPLALAIGVFGATTLLSEPVARVRFGVVTASYAVAAGFALSALAMVFGTLDPMGIALAQDRSLDLGNLFGPALPALQRFALPAWGLFLQPASALLFLVCALSIPGLATERASERDGVERFLVETGRHASALVVAAWFSVFFLGGGAVPYLATGEIIGFVSPHFGTGFAAILCMALHIGVLVSKTMLVTIALEPLRQRTAGRDFSSTLRTAWRFAIPFALLNVFLTAQWLDAGGGSP